MMFTRSLHFLAIGTTLITFSGCGGAGGPGEPEGPKASVKGKLTYNGAPVTKGTLLLNSGKGTTVSAPVSSDGTFELKGIGGAEFPAGNYTVGITPPQNPPQAPGATTMAPPPSIEGVPAHFYSPATSKVSVEIKPGKQDVNIDLR